MPAPAQTAPPSRRVSAACVLLTGFDPFGGAVLNPSWLAVQALQGHTINGHRLVAAQLPTEFGTSLQRLDALLSEHQPGMVVCVGQAGSRNGISIERVAINVDDARIPDNAGYQPVDTAVVANGPAAYFSTLPIKAMVAALGQEGIPAEISQTAGTFVCNHVFYGLMHRLAAPTWMPIRGGFIHVPSLPEQVHNLAHDACMPLDQIIRGLEIAIEAALAHGLDIQLAAGALD